MGVLDSKEEAEAQARRSWPDYGKGQDSLIYEFASGAPAGVGTAGSPQAQAGPAQSLWVVAWGPWGAVGGAGQGGRRPGFQWLLSGKQHNLQAW